MAVPILRAHKFKGAGSPEIFPLINGTVLGTSEGAFGSLESPVVHTTTGPRVFRRIIEAFGKVFLIHGPDIREKDEGGIENWGVVNSILVGSDEPDGRCSGWYLIHPAGSPLLAFLWKGNTIPGNSSDIYKTFTYDGVIWTTTSLGVSNGAITTGMSISFRDSIFWFQPNLGFTVIEHNFLLSTTTTYIVEDITDQRHAYFVVVENMLHLVADSPIAQGYKLYRFLGGAFVFLEIASITRAVPQDEGGCWGFPDGEDLIGFQCGEEVGFDFGDTAIRWVRAGDETPLRIDNPVFPAAIRPGGVLAVATATWEGIVDNNSNPGLPPTIHVWRMPGPAHSGTRVSYTWQFRALTHDSVTGGPFVVGEIVTGGTSGATGQITKVGAGKIHMTNVSTVLFQSSEVLTGSTSGATANGTSVLTEQPLILNGTSISADFSIPMAMDSIGPDIPSFPAVRIEIGITGVRLTHGATTGGPFQLGETITGGTSGATGTLFIDNLGNLVVFPTNPSTLFANGEVITGSISTAFSTMTSGPAANTSIPSKEIAGGTKHYFRVYGSTPDPVPVTTLYSSAEEQAPEITESIIAVNLESGTPPGLAPTISSGTILNLPADDGVRVWSLSHDSVGGGFSAGDVIELSLKGV